MSWSKNYEDIDWPSFRFPDHLVLIACFTPRRSSHVRKNNYLRTINLVKTTSRLRAKGPPLVGEEIRKKVGM